MSNQLTKFCCFCTYSYLEFLQALEEKVDQDWTSISSSLEEIRRSLLSREGCLVNLTADGKTLMNSEKYVSKFLDMLPNNAAVGKNKWSAQLPSSNEAIVIPTQVAFLPFPFCFFVLGILTKFLPFSGKLCWEGR